MDAHDPAKPVGRLIAPGDTFIGRQGLTYQVGISAETVGSQGLHMQIVRIPPGARAKAHKHAHHETAIYALSGTSHVWHGQQLEKHSIVPPGAFFYIPADEPHLPYNPSLTEEAVAIIARTDPNEQESVVLLPALEKTDTQGV
jgi:uncharacterized RmlC-like cupin family protein